MSIKSPVRLLPAFKDYIWGGRKLVQDYNKVCSLDKVAESWELSAHKDGSSIINGGDFDKMLFSDYINKYGNDVLGERAKKFDFFPILIKFIDAKDNLSVQVHPNDEYAKEKEGEYGKTEMWYVLDAEPGAYLYFGFNSKISKEEFLQRIKDNTITEVLNKVDVKKGDVFFIESGTVHAIGAGMVICEIQQNSNTTYRVYDYDRRDKDGNPRPLHIEKASEVAVLAPPKISNSFSDADTLAECKYFNVKKYVIDTSKTFTCTDECFTSVIVTDGSGTLYMNEESFTLKKGDSLFIPAQNSSFSVEGNLEILLTTV